MADTGDAFTRKVHAALTDSILDDVMETAGYGITYWSRQASEREFAFYPDADFVIVEADDFDTDTIHPLTYADLRRAYVLLLNIDQPYVNRTIHGYFLDSWRDRDDDGIDAGHIDSDAADVWVQVALFGEVVYG